MPETEITAVATEVADTAVAGGIAGGIAATMGVMFFVLMIAWYILQAIAEWKMFTKAGKPGWHSLIPVLRNFDVVDLSWSRTMAWVTVAIIIVSGILSVVLNGQNPSGLVTTLSYIFVVICAVIGVISTYKLSKSFGKGIGFCIGLLLLNPIFKLILGFGDAKYQGRS